MKSKSKDKFLFDKSRDKIAIIAPSSKVSNYEEIISRGLKFFESRGFSAFLVKDSFKEHSIHANAIEKRLDCMIDAINDEFVKIIWCFRGGSGSSEVACHLNRICISQESEFPSNKILVGFSDVTALHIFFNQKLNLQSIHGSMITDIQKTEENLDMVLDLLAAKEKQIKLNPINLAAEEFIKNKESLSAKICGGNLAVICSNVGTNNHPNFDDKILFLEDIGEAGYKIDRNLFHLYASKVINDKLKAIIFGDFKNCNDSNIAIKDFIMKYSKNIPCFSVSGCGHEEKNIPIVFNSEQSMIIGDILTYSIENLSE